MRLATFFPFDPLLLFVWVLCTLSSVHAQALSRERRQYNRQSEERKGTFVFLAALIGVLFFTCMYLVKRICPYNPMFSSLELEEIRVERVQDRERTIMGRIDRMKAKLTNMRRKRTEIQTRRDIAASVEDRVERFNSKGRQIYGSAWDGADGSLPVRDMIKIPEQEIKAIQMEAQVIATARKEEEKKDLWNMWNDIEKGVSEGGYNNDVGGTASSRSRNKGLGSSKNLSRKKSSTKNIFDARRDDNDDEKQPLIGGEAHQESEADISFPPRGVRPPPTSAPSPSPTKHSRQTAESSEESPSSAYSITPNVGSRRPSSSGMKSRKQHSSSGKSDTSLNVQSATTKPPKSTSDITFVSPARQSSASAPSPLEKRNRRPPPIAGDTMQTVSPPKRMPPTGGSQPPQPFRPAPPRSRPPPPGHGGGDATIPPPRDPPPALRNRPRGLPPGVLPPPRPMHPRAPPRGPPGRPPSNVSKGSVGRMDEHKAD